MIESKDIITREIQQTVVEDAMNYATQSIKYTYNRMHLWNTSQRMQKIIFGKIMEGTFVQLLREKDISFDTLGETHYTQIDKYDIGINGHRCDIKGFFLRNKETVLSNIAWLLDCCALVPTDQLTSTSLKPDDYYIFAFLTAQIQNENTPQSMHINNGMVYFCGYISKKEFLQTSTRIPAGYTLCKQYAATKTENNMMKIFSLHPMNELLH